MREYNENNFISVFICHIFHNAASKATVIFIIFFLSPEVKRSAIITYIQVIYELAHKLPNDLRLKILGNEEILEKCLRFIK